MNRSLLLLAAIAGLTASSCQNKTTEENTNTTVDQNKATALSSARTCYTYTKNRDTVLLSYERKNNTITGELSYNLFEKDKNSGKIDGIIKGDTILADYTATGEGMSYVRQVAFLKNGKHLEEGYADMKDEGGKMVFNNLTELKFSNAIDLEEGECK